jgi:autotransporter-associated beta strand protein
MIIKAPGLTAGVYDEPVMSIDLVPTFVNAAGGDSTTIATDGVDLLPFLEGEVAGSPHEVMFWRGSDGRYAVRKGKWKLMLPSASASSRLSDLEFGEPDTFYSSQPEVVADLARELTFWEATIKKPMWGPLGDDMFNEFDHFVYRTDLSTTSNWSTDGNWTQAGTSANAKLMKQDAYANAVLEFGVRNDASYVANNDMTRSTKYTFMLNELRFTGDYAGADDTSGTITGNALLLVNGLAGQPATIRNEATSSSDSQFRFNINVELQLLNDLVFDGDGTQPIVVSSTIRDYYEPRGVIKTGNSEVALAGNNLFTGALNILEGRLSATNLSGNLHVEGGTFSVTSITNVAGNYTQSGGALEITLGESSSQLVVGGSANLGGRVNVSLSNEFLPNIGQAFTIVLANELSGMFDEFVFPSLDYGGWTVDHTINSVVLRVTLPGDFNVDGVVDASDYVVWRKNPGGVFRADDFNIWRANFGRTAVIGSVSRARVPEPNTLTLMIFAAAGWCFRQSRW